MGSLPFEDHPRIRGEHRRAAGGVRQRLGIIPAYAGNTRQFKNACRFNGGSSPHTRGTRIHTNRNCIYRWDHPRIRREHRARGSPRGVGRRIIPAYAGNTFAKAVGSRKVLGSSPHTRGTPEQGERRGLYGGDHPRIRGEHAFRGTRACRWGGIIPAYAGNTPVRSINARINSGSSPHTRGTRWRNDEAKAMPVDHPRIRGEHRRVLGRHVRLAGIIPAYAGNTIVEGRAKRGFPGSSPHTRGTPGLAAPSSTCGGDHPRIRGEHDEPVQAALPDLGIIPAYAGNTEHPDARMKCPTGSSPHTRGTPARDEEKRGIQRDHPRIRGEHAFRGAGACRGRGIISAYAGNTAG